MPPTSSAKPLEKNQTPLIIHYLIGLPGSGKSTFAKSIHDKIISTDDIRRDLYGNEATQGNWHEIETEVIQRIATTLAKGNSLVYDATNFKRSYRIDFLQKVEKEIKNHKLSIKVRCIAWYLNTPLETCIAWNQQRERQVPESVINSMHAVLEKFPPVIGEGFAKVKVIKVTSEKLSPEDINKQIRSLERSIINSQNRNANITPHQYSKLADFDRLIHLISLIIRYPGVGNLHHSNPKLIENILGCKAEFSSNIQEISALMTKKHGVNYGCEKVLYQDLHYLAKVGIINDINEEDTQYDELKTKKEIKQPLISKQEHRFNHSYSDEEVFNRLIGTIKLIIHKPFLADIGEGSLKTLAKALESNRVIYSAHSGLSMLRKDIENILKPYKIILNFPMRQGYFAGTGIFSQQELVKLLPILQSQAKNLDDPLALDFHNTFKERMLQTKLIDEKENIYPIRSIANHSIVDDKYLHETSLLKKLPYLEEAIVKGELLEVSTFSSSPKYRNDANSFILVYPLQIVFHNLAWYLGYECIRGDEEPQLIRFKRLDRLFLGRFQNHYRSRQEQDQALEKLQNLLKGSAGIHLGDSVSDQIQFLSQDKKKRMAVCTTVELWFNDKTFHFVTEGTKRFTYMKMSRPQFASQVNLPKSIFCLQGTGDKQFPNRFQTVLAQWSLNDFDLLRWIIGFGNNVKVIKPQPLIDKVKNTAQGIVDVY